MACRRLIDDSLFEDYFIGQLELFGRYLWVGLISAVADDQGRFLDSPAIVRARVFPYDDLNDAQVISVMDRLAEAGKIVRYRADGHRLVQISNWWAYQQPSWATPSRYPAPDGWVDRAKYHTKGNRIIVLNWESAGGYVDNVPSPLSSQLPSPIPSPLHNDLSDVLLSSIEEQEKIEELDDKQKQKNHMPAPAPAALISSLTEPMIQRAWTIATNMIAIPPGDQSRVMPVLKSISGQYDTAEKFAAAIKPYYQAWLNRRTVDGRAYSRTNLGWIDWMAAGEIPPIRGEDPTKKVGQPSAAEIAAALRGGEA